MSDLLDTSVLVAALVPDEPGHPESLDLLTQGPHCIYSHALLETFATLTGGRLGVRVDAKFAARMLRESILPRVHVIELELQEILAALDEARSQGVRGGAVYDYMHLVAARKANAKAIRTYNVSNFEHLLRDGDPVIEKP